MLSFQFLNIRINRYLIVYLVVAYFLCHTIDSVATEQLQNNNRIVASNVAVVVNTEDANSVEIGQYYLKARNVPSANLIKVRIEKGQAELTEQQFKEIRNQIYAKLTNNIDVILLAWTTPYAVHCNSITSAITMGYQAEQCQDICGPGIKNAYYNSGSHRPFNDFNMRLAILLPTDSLDLAKAIIDRGLLSSFKINEATAYFLKTNDANRSKPREPFFPKKEFIYIEAKKLHLRTISANSIHHKKDIMFYFTGTTIIPYLDTLNFMPGAVADHLTSFGGILLNNDASSLKWLEAGATGTYGSVSEPCNYWQKFPNPKVLLEHYVVGDTLIEAYWKSVNWVTQGLIMGDPLASPYAKE